MQGSDVINDVIDDEPIVIVFHAESDLAVGYKRPIINNNFIELEKVSDVFPFDIKEKNGDAVWSFIGELKKAKEGYDNLIPIVTAYKGFWLSWGTYYNNIEIYSP